MPPLADDAWPDAVDLVAILFVAGVGLGLPLAGYVFLSLDIRAYLRSLGRAMVVARGYAATLPEWVKRDTPPCLAALGLRPPCTREEVLSAYREKVKTAHPDQGGSRREFARLQRHFEDAMTLASDAEPAPPRRSTTSDGTNNA